MHTTVKRLTKRQRRTLKKEGVFVDPGLKGLIQVQPLTDNQERAFNSYFSGKNLMLHGSPGTGKTYVAFYLALNDIINHDMYDKLIVVRSVVPTRDMGFLPGSQTEKMRVYEAPYYSICHELFNKPEAYQILKQKEKLEFISTSFIRGLTINDAVIIIDEMQNMTWQELMSIITRIGENCKVLLCGDTKQSDLTEKTGKMDLQKLIMVCQRMGSFDFIQMSKEDIVRSGFVKEFILTCEELGY